jgi:hypothetical protein
MVIIVIVNAGYSPGTENTRVFVQKTKQHRAFTTDFHLVTAGRNLSDEACSSNKRFAINRRIRPTAFCDIKIGTNSSAYGNVVDHRHVTTGTARWELHSVRKGCGLDEIMPVMRCQNNTFPACN